MQAGSEHNSIFGKLLEYEQRSASHGVAGPAEQEKLSNWVGVVFRLGAHHLTAGIEKVSEILNLSNYTQVPGAKPWILGLANIRGNLVTLCDLSWFLSGVRTPITARTRILVTDMQNRPMGFLVDEVIGQRHFHSDDAQETDQFGDSEVAPFVRKLFQSSNESWGLLEIDELLSDSGFINGAA